MDGANQQLLLMLSKMLLGHLWADYMLQPQKMAERKGQAGWQNLLICLLHCLIYTLALTITCWRADPLFLTVIFVSHFPIDRWSLGKYWLKLIKGRDLQQAALESTPAGIVRTAFACHVYVAVDFTLHFTLLYLALQFGLI